MDTDAPLSRRRVIRAFKMHGLALQAPALEAMMNVLQRENSSQEVLDAILDEIRDRRLQQPVVTEALLADVVADMSRDGRDVQEEALQLLDAYDTPRLDFDTMRKQFSLVDNPNRSFFGEANDKVRCIEIVYMAAVRCHDNIDSFYYYSTPTNDVFRQTCLHRGLLLFSSVFFVRTSFVPSLSLQMAALVMEETLPMSLLPSRVSLDEPESSFYLA